MDRTKYIGGSDIAAIMLMSRWQTPLGVWAEKTGKVINKLNIDTPEYVQLGMELEEFVAMKFTQATGKKVRRDSRNFTHPQFPYMQGHIDRRVTGTDEILECKTCSAWKEKEWLGEDIPQEYIMQLMWYLGLTKSSKGYLAVLIGGQKFIWKEVMFDQELFDKMVITAEIFWKEFVQKDVQPMACGDDNATLFELFPTSDIDKAITFEGDEETEVNQLLEARAAGIQAKKEISEEIAECDAKLKQKLGTAEKGQTGQYSFTWKLQNRKEYTVAATSMRVLRCVDNTKKRGKA